jgi:hypothetical protein
MASGKPCAIITDIVPPGSSFARYGHRIGASTPKENVPFYAFAAAANEYLDYYGVISGYASGGFTVRYGWMAASATSGAIVMAGAFRLIDDDAEDLDTTAFTYAYNNGAAATAPSATGEVSYDTITFTNGADSDSIIEGSRFVFRLWRNQADGSDNMSGDAQVFILIIEET